MQKFIEVHTDGRARLINLSHVEEIFGDVNATLFTGNRYADVDESYAEVRSLIAKAQGGLPTKPIDKCATIL